MSKQTKAWIVYDERARTQSTHDCMVLVSCHSEDEAKDYVRDDFPHGVIFSYDLIDGVAVNETLVN